MDEQKRAYRRPVKKTDMASLYALIAPVLAQNGTVKMKVAGFSMYPLVASRRDSVLLGKADALKIGDVPLFQRADGSFILHRIVGKKDGAFYLCGDYETKKEYPVYPDQIVAVAKGFYRKERFISCDSFLYKLYSFLWRSTFYMRPLFITLLGIYARQKDKFLAKHKNEKKC